MVNRLEVYVQKQTSFVSSKFTQFFYSLENEIVNNNNNNNVNLFNVT